MAKVNNHHLKYTIGNDAVELLRAEVVAIDYSDSELESHYSILARPLSMTGGFAPTDLIKARPLDVNLKKLPVLHEIVLILKGPSPYSSAINMQAQSYFINTFSLQNNIHQNSLPNVTEIVTQTNEGNSVGFTDKEESKFEFGDTFKEDTIINPLQPYAGDILLEGRFGHAIRFGSTTLEESKVYTVGNLLKKASGKYNDPYTVISNGRLKPKEFGKFITEDTKNDLVSIYMTSTQGIQLEPKTNKFAAITRLAIDTFNKGPYKFAGSQLGLFSKGRIVVNSDEQEIIMMSGGGIGFSSNKSICFDTAKTFEIGNAKRINLGLDAKEPALMGDTTGEWLSDLLTQMQNLCVQLSQEIHGTGVGPSTPPVNASEYVRLQSEFQRLQQTIPTLKSQLVYLNKNENTSSITVSSVELERANVASEMSDNQRQVADTGTTAGQGINDSTSGGLTTPPDNTVNLETEEKSEPLTPEEEEAVEECGGGAPPEPPANVIYAMKKWGIESPLQKAHFLAQVAHESGRFKWKREIWGPTPTQERYEGRRDLGNVNPGDGSKYRGRGYIQLTGRANYMQFNKGVEDDVVSNPKLVETKYPGETAGWFWKTRKINNKATSDSKGAVKAVTKVINGGTNGLKDREELFCAYWKILKANPSKWS